ncbi:MAG: hypothetical protein ACOYJC_08775 [Christensenellales bacterium]|jgi:hypothetical protein
MELFLIIVLVGVVLSIAKSAKQKQQQEQRKQQEGQGQPYQPPIQNYGEKLPVFDWEQPDAAAPDARHYEKEMKVPVWPAGFDAVFPVDQPHAYEAAPAPVQHVPQEKVPAYQRVASSLRNLETDVLKPTKSYGEKAVGSKLAPAPKAVKKSPNTMRQTKKTTGISSHLSRDDVGKAIILGEVLGVPRGRRHAGMVAKNLRNQ